MARLQARVVKCWIKSRNERNPYPLCQRSGRELKGDLASDKLEEAWMTSSHHGPYDQGYTRAAMAHTKRSDLAEQADLIKCVVVRIESATRLHEVGIASNRGSECHGEYVPGPCTHRPSTPWEWVAKEVGSLTFGGRHFVIHDWVKS